jgi:phenylalanine-4-hydroxylase
MRRALTGFAQAHVGPWPEDLASVVVSIANNSPGALNSILSCFQKQHINLARIESQFNDPLVHESGHSFLIDVIRPERAALDHLLADLKGMGAKAELVGGYHVPWFPKSRRDLDFLEQRLMEAGAELTADHPGFSDQLYRDRRKEIADIAFNYRLAHGPVPKVKYTDAEVKTWKTIYETLSPLHKLHACNEFKVAMTEMEQSCGFAPSHIPQIADINAYLATKTGFMLRPVAGLLTGRDFLNSLAFRVFSSTQYVRHHSVPFYTPEPDIVHEFLGHVPLFADKEFANFSQEIGLASLGASDTEINQLATCYWFSVEFGVIEEGGRKIYGAGILSSADEIKNATRPDIEIRPFDPASACNVPYPVTSLQPFYYMAPNFKQMKELMRKYALGIRRGFSLTYNSAEHSVRTDRHLNKKK